MVTAPTSPEPPDSKPENPPIISFGRQSRDVVPVLAIASGVAAVLSRQQPTGNLAADVVLSFIFGCGLVWLGQFAQAQALVASAVLALFFSGLAMPAILIGGAAVASAVFVTAWRRFDEDSWAIGAAMSAAFTCQAVLNLPSIRFAGSASVLAAVALAPIAITGFRKLPDRLRATAVRSLVAFGVYSVIATALAVVAALSVRDHVEVAIEQAEDGVTAVEQGDQPQALVLLAAAQSNFERSSDRLGGLMTWPSRIVPIAAQHSRALETAAEQGAALAATATRTITQADVDNIRGQDGMIDVSLIEGVNAELNLANRTLIAAQASLRDVNTPWLLPQLSSRLESVNDELASTAADIDLATQGTSVLPGILGANGQRRYLVLFVQPAESREFGGFVGAYGLLEVNDGRFNLAESGSINADFGSGKAEFTDPENFPYSYLLAAPNQHPQNLTAVGDLSTISDAVYDLAPQWRQNPDFVIDGVITIDPYALAGMLELTGPIDVSGLDVAVDSTNVVDFLLRGQYIEFDDAGREQRQDVLHVLAGAAFNELFEIDIPGPEQLGSIFGPVARANRLSMTTVNDLENAFLDRILLSAELPDVGSAVDMVGVFSQTGTASKLDAYATRAITYDVIFDPATGGVSATLVVADNNNAPVDAPAFVLGAKQIEGPEGNPLAEGNNFVALALYTRADLISLEADTSFHLPDPSPAFSYMRNPISYEVPLGGAAHVTAELSSTVEPGRYDVYIPAQAAAEPATFTLNVSTAPGWKISGRAGPTANWSQTFTLDEARGFTFTFETDG